MKNKKDSKQKVICPEVIIFNLIILFVILIYLVLIIVYLYISTFPKNLNKKCYEADFFSFANNKNYTKCFEDVDCIAKSAGCLNINGAKNFSFWAKHCANIIGAYAPPEGCICQDGQCAIDYHSYENIREIKELEIITDKEEYKQREEVKVTVRNNLDEEIYFPFISVEKFSGDKWEEVRFDIDCPCLSDCNKASVYLLPNQPQEFSWDQEIDEWNTDNDSCFKAFLGRYRFKLNWGKIGNKVEEMAISYSDEFNIMEGNEDVGCGEDVDCEAKFSSCDCQYHCMNKDEELTQCLKPCPPDELIPTECKCIYDTCVDLGDNDAQIIAKINYLNKNRELSHDDWDWDLGDDCYGLSSVSECEKINWPMSCSCRVAEKDQCYGCFAYREKDDEYCDKIDDEFSRNDCYWGVVVVFEKAGIEDQIDFCHKIAPSKEDARRDECYKIAK